MRAIVELAVLLREFVHFAAPNAGDTPMFSGNIGHEMIIDTPTYADIKVTARTRTSGLWAAQTFRILQQSCVCEPPNISGDFTPTGVRYGRYANISPSSSACLDPWMRRSP
jgi:hypothetical protein